MRNEIMLLGPMVGGKTTLSKKISLFLELPHLDIDNIRWDYFNYFGFKNSQAEKFYDDDGIRGLIRYYKEYELKTLKRVLIKYTNCIFDIGAGFPVHYNLKQQNFVNSLLEKFKNVFVILPHPDMEKGNRILSERMEARCEVDTQLRKILRSTPEYDLNYSFIKFYYQQLKLGQIIYSHEKNADDMVKEITGKVI